jgi:hypothetical protein
MLRRVALVRTDVSEELSTTRRNIPEDALLHLSSSFLGPFHFTVIHNDTTSCHVME